MISRLLDDQLIRRRRKSRKAGALARIPVLERQGRRVGHARRLDARRLERRELGARILALFRIVALAAAVGALATGLVIMGRPETTAALGTTVVPDDVRQAAMTLPGAITRAPEAGPGGAEAGSGDAGSVEFERTEDVEYVVAEGETLSGIARRFNLPYAALAEYNGLPDPHTLVPGQRLFIPREDVVSDLGAIWIPTL